MDATVEASAVPELSKELAARVSMAVAAIDGVRGALVCSRDGAILGATGQGDHPRDAALASFLGSRAETLSIDSDLRGMGRMLAGSQLEQMTFSGPGGDSLLLPAGSAYLFVSLVPGRPAATLGPQAAATAKRYL